MEMELYNTKYYLNLKVYSLILLNLIPFINHLLIYFYIYFLNYFLVNLIHYFNFQYYQKIV